jgi:uncharacterized protein with GYD domain
MFFISLCKFRKKPTKEMVAQTTKLFEQITKEGNKIVAQYYTLGRYDVISILEGKDEKTALKHLIRFGDMLSSETLIAVPREEALKFIE